MPSNGLTLDKSIPLGGLVTIFLLTLQGLLQWRRLMMMVFLTIVPLAGAVIFRLVGEPLIMGEKDYTEETLLRVYYQVEFFAVLVYYSSVVAPLTILLLASGMIRDEQENQTLTYLFICPIPRWALYLSKLVAAILVAWLITALSMGLVLFTLWYGSNVHTPHSWVTRWIALLPSTALLIAANGGLFGLISVLLRPSLIIGVIYIALFEGFLANYEFILRKFTSVHYFQCLVCNWIGEQYQEVKAIEWSIMKNVRPETQECVIVLLSIFLVSTLLAMYFFTTREFRMKTPEGN